MAMACLRLFTLPPRPPLPDRSVPCFLRRIALATRFPAALPYLRRLDDFLVGIFFLKVQISDDLTTKKVVCLSAKCDPRRLGRSQSRIEGLNRADRTVSKILLGACYLVNRLYRVRIRGQTLGSGTRQNLQVDLVGRQDDGPKQQS